MKLKNLALALFALSAIVLLAGCASPAPDGPIGPQTPTTKYPDGSASAKVVIVEYSDFQCPFCGAAAVEIKRFKQDYGQEVRHEFRQFPLDNACNSGMGGQLHANACKAAVASECAADQKKFWEYHDRLFANQKNLDVASLKVYAAELGLDTEKFNNCLDTREKLDAVKKEIGEGYSAGVDGTPAFFFNGKKMNAGATYENFVIAYQNAKLSG